MYKAAKQIRISQTIIINGVIVIGYGAVKDFI